VPQGMGHGHRMGTAPLPHAGTCAGLRGATGSAGLLAVGLHGMRETGHAWAQARHQVCDMAAAAPRKIDRIPDLDAASFAHDYVKKGIPVITTGPEVDTIVPKHWGLDYLQERCDPLMQGSVKTRVSDSPALWAGLAPVANSSVNAFIKELKAGGNEGRYLFDWGVQHHCPGIIEEFRVPKYLSSDVLQKLIPNTSWPSLMIASKGTGSGLHLDSFGTHFWMLLLKGRKKWTVFPREESALLGYSHFNHRFPAATERSQTTPWEFTLEAGELLVVPHSMAHEVENMEETLALAGNFVDANNYDSFLEQIHLEEMSAERVSLRKLVPKVYSTMKTHGIHKPEQLLSTAASLSWPEFKQGR